MTPKIATCCYCGTKAALVLDRERHELTCSSCGAPLHDLKRIPVDRYSSDAPRGSGKKRKPAKHKYDSYQKQRPYPKRKKRRKGLLEKVFEEAFDVIEDIFD